MKRSHKAIVELLVGILFIFVGTTMVTGGINSYFFDGQWWHWLWSGLGFLVVIRGVNIVTEAWSKV